MSNALQSQSATPATSVGLSTVSDNINDSDPSIQEWSIINPENINSADNPLLAPLDRLSASMTDSPTHPNEILQHLSQATIYGAKTAGGYAGLAFGGSVGAAIGLGIGLGAMLVNGATLNRAGWIALFGLNTGSTIGESAGRRFAGFITRTLSLGATLWLSSTQTLPRQSSTRNEPSATT